MTKDVLVKISGLQVLAGAEGLGSTMSGEKIEVIAPGAYYCKGGSHFVIYEEIFDEIPEVAKVMVKIKGKRMEIHRHGAIRTKMTFEAHEKNVTSYMTPFGEMMVGVATRAVELKQTPDQMNVSVDYGLEVNYQFVSDCLIEMEIQSRSGAQLNLQS
ncbi:MAG: DUF1934 domain-containing protein [Lachnospiraceae bacterium]|jgi:uncharacterized beta-barrel protein YwiB (DUF1934 family)|nr:DUF1934 domain-containing protein [Lachnospiraceae bacterium]